MERRSCFARFLLILATIIARSHSTSTHASSISISSPNPSSSTTASSASSSSSPSPPSAAVSISCPTNNASIRTLFRCRPDIFQSRTVCVGEKWTLRCLRATFISILSAQITTAASASDLAADAESIHGQDRCVNSTNRPKGTSCAGHCLTPLFEQQCQGKRKCSSKDQQHPVSSDFEPCGSPSGAGLEDHPFSVTYACVSKEFLSQSVSAGGDLPLVPLADRSNNNDCLQRSRGVVQNEDDDDNDDDYDPAASPIAEGQQQNPSGQSGRQLQTTPSVPELNEYRRRSEVLEPRLPRRLTNEPLEVIVEVTQIHLEYRRSTSQHRGNIGQGRNSTDEWRSGRHPMQQTIAFLTTTTTIGGGRGGRSDGGGFAGWYGNVSEWLWTWKYIQERRENFFLYMTLALLFGVMSVLIVLILRLTQRNRKTRRQHRGGGMPSRRPKSESAPLTSSRGSPVAWRTPESDRSLPGVETTAGGRTPRPPVELTSFNRVGSLPGLDCGTPPPPMPPPPPMADSPSGEFRGSDDDGEFQVEQQQQQQRLRRMEFPVVEFPGERRGEFRVDGGEFRVDGGEFRVDGGGGGVGGGGESKQTNFDAMEQQQRTEPRRDFQRELRRGFSHEFLGDVCSDFKRELRGGGGGGGGEFVDMHRDFSRDMVSLRRDFQRDDQRGEFPRGDFPRNISSTRGDFQRGELIRGADYPPPRNLRGDFQKELRGGGDHLLRGDFQKDNNLREDFPRDFPRAHHHVPPPSVRGDPSSYPRLVTATINRSLCGQLNSSSGLRFGRTSFMDTAPIFPSGSVVTPSFTLPGERLFPARRHHSLAGLDFRTTDAAEQEAGFLVGGGGGRRSLQQSPCSGGRDYLVEMELMECLKTLQPVIRQYNREAGFATS